MFHDATGAPISVAVASKVGRPPRLSRPNVGRPPWLSRPNVGVPAWRSRPKVGVPRGGRVPTWDGRRGDGRWPWGGKEAAVLLALMGGRGGWSLDALVDASGLGVGAVQGALMGLELDGRVSFDALGSYAPSTAPGAHPL
jgi:hypothetical protein